MSDYLDSEAEESEDEEYQKKRPSKRKALDSDDDDEEDDEEAEGDLKDLIDDNPIEESDGDDSDGSEGSGKKRKKSDEEDDLEDDRLEDEDYDLLEENLGVRVERKKRFKRLRRIQDEESEEEQEEEKGAEKEAVANELFEGSGDELDERDEDRSSERREEIERFDEEGEDEGELSSDADDFIVDDDGRPIADKRRKRKPIYTDAALQEAQDIFGVDFDYDEFDKYDEEEYEEEEESQEDAEERDRRRKKTKKKAGQKATKKSIFELYEPSELKRGHFTDLDNQIRTTDIPERMQLRDTPVTSVPEGSDELEEEAEWIYKQAFCKPTVSIQDGSGSDEREKPKKGPQTIGKIKKALDFMRNHHLEVPFIAFYRKEYVQPELNINDLWRVYRFDEKWSQLRNRKATLVKLFEKMRDYQGEQLMADPDKPIPEGVRVLTDEDIMRVKTVQTMEEMRDVHKHFVLYYGHEVPAMQAAMRAKERELRAEARRSRQLRRRRRTIINDDGEEVEVEDDTVEDEEDELPDEEELKDEIQQEAVKLAVRSGPYAMCRKARLEGFAKRFGLTPEQFAENLRDNYQRHEVEQESVEPVEVAKEYLSAQFNTAEEVVKAAKFMVATQLSREPLVRKCVRETLFERCKLDVIPTKKGIKEIDENHAIYSMKYLKGKPVRDLSKDQFLKLVIAEEDKLITIKFNEQIEGLTTSSFLEEAKQLYLKDEFIKHVQEWNTLRMECVELALTKMLMPDMVRDLKNVLVAEAKENVLKACCRKLYNWLKIAPYSVEFPDEDDDEWDTSKGLRVMAVAYVPDFTQAAFACVVGPDGDVIDHLRLPSLLKRKNTFREDEKLMKSADLTALRNFIASKKPHVIAVGGESREALMVVADLKEVVTQLVENDQFPSVNVEVVNNELAKVYANSIKGTNEFRDYPLLLRQAVSLARRLQDPLTEHSQLCTSDEEILCLRYHPLQDQIPKEELLDALYLEFVNRTNEVGVDINAACQTGQTTNLVQFICGLGPRKGAALLKLLKQTNQRLENRTQLVTACHMGPKVFINCAGFIRIDTNSLGDSTELYVEVLDGSRVHPETYEWARKMAVDALEYDEANDEEANPAGALEEILEAPERLKDLDLDAFAEELERQNFGNKSITLYDIRAELNHRYKDLRTPYSSPNAEELFDMLTKESPETFYIGKLVLATVIGIQHRKPQGEQLDQANPVRNDETGLWQCPFCLKNDFPELSEVWNHFDAEACPGKATGVRLRLDNGIQGYIHIKNLSDKHVSNPEERVNRGQIIHCRVIKIDVPRFSVECTSKSSDLADANHEWRPQRDPYYDRDLEAKDKKTEEDAKKQKQRQTYIKRVIVHPSFHNISYTEAEKVMATMDQGEAIIRPSSKGADHLTVTWKVTDGIYQHIDVREEGKENSFSLGQSLWIGSDEFEDLDEIIARHVNPMAAHARDILSFKYYRDTGGKKDKADELLKEEKRRNPNKIHYFISATSTFPGKFLLSYMPRARCQHEYITVTPEGFRFRQQTFESLAMLFKWFKEHFRDPIPGNTPSTPRGQVTGRTPYPGTPSINMANIDPAIQRVAQTMPTHMLQSLSQVASQTPHYPHAYGYANTPYTPSGQTPFMTPYQTPLHTAHTPRYGQPTPNISGTFLHPGAVTPAGRTPSHRPMPTPHTPHTPHSVHAGSSSRGGSGTTDPQEWKKRAEDWRRLHQDPGRSSGSSRGSSGTPRFDDRGTPRSQMGSSPYVPGGSKQNTPHYDGDDRGTPRSDISRASRSSTSHYSKRYDPADVSRGSSRSSSAYGHGQRVPFASPHGSLSARSTPRTIASPESMVESSGDATPLYDEN